MRDNYVRFASGNQQRLIFVQNGIQVFEANSGAAFDGIENVLLELVSAIGLWRMVSGVLRSLEVPLEEGVSSWPPDGAAPS